MGERYLVWQVVRKLEIDGIKICEETLRRWERKGKVDRVTRDHQGRRFWTPDSYRTLKVRMREIFQYNAV